MNDCLKLCLYQLILVTQSTYYQLEEGWKRRTGGIMNTLV